MAHKAQELPPRDNAAGHFIRRTIRPVDRSTSVGRSATKVAITVTVPGFMVERALATPFMSAVGWTR